MSAVLLAHVARRSLGPLVIADRVDIGAAVEAFKAAQPLPVSVVVPVATAPAPKTPPAPMAELIPWEDVQHAIPGLETLREKLARERLLFLERERIVRERQAASVTRIQQLEAELASAKGAFQETAVLCTDQQRTIEELSALVTTLRAQAAPAPGASVPEPERAHEAPPTPAAPTTPEHAPLLAIPISGTREGMDLARFATLHGVRARYDLKTGTVVADTDLSAAHAAWLAWKEQR